MGGWVRRRRFKRYSRQQRCRWRRHSASMRRFKSSARTSAWSQRSWPIGSRSFSWCQPGANDWILSGGAPSANRFAAQPPGRSCSMALIFASSTPAGCTPAASWNSISTWPSTKNRRWRRCGPCCTRRRSTPVQATNAPQSVRSSSDPIGMRWACRGRCATASSRRPRTCSARCCVLRRNGQCRRRSTIHSNNR